jgi:hypothetical protein
VLRTDQIIPGDVVVIPAGYGGCDELGWNPSSGTHVTDIGDAVAFTGGRRCVPRLEIHACVDSLPGKLKSRAASEDGARRMPRRRSMIKRTLASRMPAVRTALREAEAQNYSWSSLIAAIVKAPSDLHRPVEAAVGHASLSSSGAGR